MKRFLPLLALSLFAFAASARAEDDHHKADDVIMITLSAEDWVTTKTARVVVGVEAAVSDKNAGTTRTDMNKAVNDLSKGEWRLTSFNRNLDQTGLEHWSATYEARVAESELNGLADSAKKVSKAGMQLNVRAIDFTPTLDEMETARANLRTKLMKQANDQLTTVNSTLPGRTYRISGIYFAPAGGEENMETPRPKMMRAMAAPAMMSAAGAASDGAVSEERSQKLVLSAAVSYAALAPTSATIAAAK